MAPGSQKCIGTIADFDSARVGACRAEHVDDARALVVEDGRHGHHQNILAGTDDHVGADAHFRPQLGVRGIESDYQVESLVVERPVCRRACQRPDARHLPGEFQIREGFDMDLGGLSGLDAMHLALAD